MMAMDEYAHTRNSLKALKTFIAGLERIKGRKALLLFNENGIIYPAVLYGQTDFDVGDNFRLLEAVGAEATTARTAVYTAYTGSENAIYTASPTHVRGNRSRLAISAMIAGTSVNFGANLAEFTGGGYNKGPSDLSSLVEKAGRPPTCIYRIGIVPPPEGRGGVYLAKVEVRGRPIESTYRVQNITGADRWLRNAVSVLAHPNEAMDLPVSAAIVPVRADADGWDLAVQVAIDTRSLQALKAPGGTETKWEVGAILVRDGVKQDWQMLGVSDLHRGAGGTGAPIPVVHERTFQRMRPGVYRLAAFVRDRTANLFGGAEAAMRLPDPAGEAVAGPVFMLSGGRRVVSDLPAFAVGGSTAARATRAESGPVPAGGEPAPAGETLEAWTWVCPKQPVPPAGKLLRYISKDGRPIVRLEDAEAQRAGRCFFVRDRIDTGALGPGAYAFHFLWDRGAEGARETQELFQVRPARDAVPRPEAIPSPEVALPEVAPPDRDD